MNRCEQSDLPVEQCSHCRGLDKRPTVPSSLPTMQAQFDSHCRGCGGRIREDDTLYLTEDGWVDRSCAEQ